MIVRHPLEIGARPSQAPLVVEAIKPVPVWGLPLAPYTFDQAVDRIDKLIQSGRPHYFITANIHYAMLTEKDPSLAAINAGAAFIVADGMPLVWASRLKKLFGLFRRGRKTALSLPQRVTGADLFPALCSLAAARGYRVFLLGGAPGVGEEAVMRLLHDHKELQVVGVESPPFRPLTPTEHDELIRRIRSSQADLLMVAFGQPRGERWLAENLTGLGVPVCVQIGAALDFMAGRIPRAPRLVQDLGLEWAYRLYREPRRLLFRYLANGLFVLRKLAWDLITLGRGERCTEYNTAL